MRNVIPGVAVVAVPGAPCPRTSQLDQAPLPEKFPFSAHSARRRRSDPVLSWFMKKSLRVRILWPFLRDC
jgi:hypothetical protein